MPVGGASSIDSSLVQSISSSEGVRARPIISHYSPPACPYKLALPYPALPDFAQPCPALPDPAQPYQTLPVLPVLPLSRLPFVSSPLSQSPPSAFVTPPVPTLVPFPAPAPGSISTRLCPRAPSLPPTYHHLPVLIRCSQSTDRRVSECATTRKAIAPVSGAMSHAALFVLSSDHVGA